MTHLTDTQRAFVEEFGSIYESYGLQRLKGLLVGVLLTQPQPLSLGELALLLGRSKGPISEAVRQLAQVGLLRKVEGPHRRRDYYAADPDLFHNNFRFNMQTVRRNLATAERFLDKAGDDEAAFREHLEHMRAFYQLMEDFYRRFSTEWEKVKHAP